MAESCGWWNLRDKRNYGNLLFNYKTNCETLINYKLTGPASTRELEPCKMCSELILQFKIKVSKSLVIFFNVCLNLKLYY